MRISLKLWKIWKNENKTQNLLFIINHFPMGLSLCIVGHFLRLKCYKCKTARFSAFLIHDQSRVCHCSIFAKIFCWLTFLNNLTKMIPKNFDQILIGCFCIQIENGDHIWFFSFLKTQKFIWAFSKSKFKVMKRIYIYISCGFSWRFFKNIFSFITNAYTI